VATTVRDRILAGAGIAAVTEAGIVAAAAVGDVVVDAIAADAHRVVPAGAIFLLRSTRRHKVANLVDTIIAADSLAVTTIGVRRFRATPHPR